MKTPQKIAYFPVTEAEQRVLERIRQPDLAARAAAVLPMLDLLAENDTSPADLEQALTLLQESLKSEALDARFQNLEARLSTRIEHGLIEIEGRLAKLVAGAVETPSAGVPAPAQLAPLPLLFVKPAPSSPITPSHAPAPTQGAQLPATSKLDVPKEANLAFNVAGDLVWGPTAAQFWRAIWKWLLDRRYFAMADLPIKGGKQRHVIAATPVHPTGKDFFGPQPFNGAFIETNMSRANIASRAAKHLEDYGIPHTVLVGPTP